MKAQSYRYRCSPLATSMSLLSVETLLLHNFPKSFLDYFSQVLSRKNVWIKTLPSSWKNSWTTTDFLFEFFVTQFLTMTSKTLYSCLYCLLFVLSSILFLYRLQCRYLPLIIVFHGHDFASYRSGTKYWVKANGLG